MEPQDSRRSVGGPGGGDVSVSCLGFIESNTTGTGRLFEQAAHKIGVSALLFTANPDRY